MDLVVASSNPHKIRELSKLLEKLPVRLHSLTEYKDLPEIIEDGKSFEENAGKKAKIIHNHLKLSVLADDSGLEVPALNNEPGVYSARYAGKNSSDKQNNELLLQKMKYLTGEQRKARFVCTLCFIRRDTEIFFNGYSEGLILEEFRGDNGFGYDPLFYVPSLDRTYAELSDDEKSAISHRGKAMTEFKNYLVKLI
ncbi:MAG: XTP/dITP diphosphatase [Calditrichaceae bacterium]|nr:XTP/dITP diphosphatase [Calditrichaceae bacterium]MBN2709501.1 XTP/dITP diphosphatase [Calditrichaceae bacterium]